MNYLVRDPVFAQHQFDEMMTRRAASIAPEPNTFSQMGTALGQVILGYKQLFAPGAVAAKMDALWAANDSVATDNGTPGITYYFAHTNRRLGAVAWDFTTNAPTSQTYFNAAANTHTYVLYNPAATHKRASVYQGGVFAGHVLAPPRTLVSPTQLLVPTATFAALGSTPENGATGVAATLTQVAVAFSKNVDAATLAGAGIGGPGVTGLNYVSGHGTRMAVFVITGSVQAGETYTFTLPASVATTEGGATLGAGFSATFQIKPADTLVGGGSYLTGHYRLDETSGTVATDSSPYAQHGTFKNGPLLSQTGVITYMAHNRNSAADRRISRGA